MILKHDPMFPIILEKKKEKKEREREHDPMRQATLYYFNQNK